MFALCFVVLVGVILNYFVHAWQPLTLKLFLKEKIDLNSRLEMGFHNYDNGQILCQILSIYHNQAIVQRGLAEILELFFWDKMVTLFGQNKNFFISFCHLFSGMLRIRRWCIEWWRRGVYWNGRWQSRRLSRTSTKSTKELWLTTSSNESYTCRENGFFNRGAFLAAKKNEGQDWIRERRD